MVLLVSSLEGGARAHASVMSPPPIPVQHHFERCLHSA